MSRLLAALLLAAALAGCTLAPRRAERPESPPAPAAPPPGSTAPEVSQTPDAAPRAEPRSRRGNPPFYEVMGKRYFVMRSAEGYVERGVASWYGPGFHAAQTSNGERYDMYAMTAAHKTLPLPTWVRVTNLANGRSVVVRVNDRGPFVANRIIDLSYAAASRLDMLREGTALVEVRALGDPAGAPPSPVTVQAASPTPSPVATANAAPASTPPAGGGLYVQAGAFSEERNALRLVERLRAAGLTNVVSLLADGGGRRMHRVRVGPVATVGEFDRLVERLVALGVADARLALD